MRTRKYLLLFKRIMAIVCLTGFAMLIFDMNRPSSVVVEDLDGKRMSDIVPEEVSVMEYEGFWQTRTYPSGSEASFDEKQVEEPSLKQELDAEFGLTSFEKYQAQKLKVETVIPEATGSEDPVGTIETTPPQKPRRKRRRRKEQPQTLDQTISNSTITISEVIPQTSTMLRHTPSRNSKLASNEKYITFYSNGGFANQLRASQRVATLALKLNRTLILPPLVSVHVARQTWYQLDLQTSPSNFRALKPISKAIADRAYSSQSWYTLRSHDEFAKIGLRRPLYLSDHLVDAERAMENCWNKRVHTFDKLPPDMQDSLENDHILCVGNGDKLPVAPLDFYHIYAPNQLILDSVDQFLHEQRLGSFLALHIRRGDFSKFCKQMKRRVSGFNYRACWPSWTEIYERVESVQQQFGITKVFLSTNERHPDLLKEFETRGWVLMSSDFVRQYLQNSPDFRDNAENVETHAALAEIVLSQFIASRAKVFIGTYYSSFTGFIRYLRGFKNSLLWA